MVVVVQDESQVEFQTYLLAHAKQNQPIAHWAQAFLCNAAAMQ